MIATKELLVVETVQEAQELARATASGEHLAFQMQLQSPKSPRAAGFFAEDVELLRSVTAAVQEFKPDFNFNRCQSFKGLLGQVAKWHIDSSDDWETPSHTNNCINSIDAHKGRIGVGEFTLVQATTGVVNNPRLGTAQVVRGRIYGVDDLNDEYTRDLHGNEYFAGISQPGRYTFINQGSKLQGILPPWHRVETISLFRLATSLSHDIRGPQLLTGKHRDIIGRRALDALAA